MTDLKHRRVDRSLNALCGGLEECRIDVDPEPAAAHGFGNCAGRSGSAKGVEHHVADERVEPDQPPWQFLREWRRVSLRTFHVLRIHPPNLLRQIAVEFNRNGT